jgi:hypothetical protein
MKFLAAQRWLATHEGIFVEPASARADCGPFQMLRIQPARPVYPSTQIPEGRQNCLHGYRARPERPRSYADTS